MRSYVAQFSVLTCIMLIVLCNACEPKGPAKEITHQPMHDAYHALSSAVHHGHLDSIFPMMNQKSQDFYNKITEPKNLNLDSIIAIGTRYRVPYFSMKYLGSCGDYMKESNDTTDFFRFLSATDISIFSKDHNYKLLKEESRLEKDAWVAIYKVVDGVNRVDWIKFTRPDSLTYEYDLIYNLKLEERINRKIFKQQRKKFYELNDEEFIKMYFPTFDKQLCGIEQEK